MRNKSKSALKKKSACGRRREDRISALPDDILHRILSFLDIDSAVQTSVLSKRWVNVWTTMPYVKLDTTHRNIYFDYYFHMQFINNRYRDSHIWTFTVDLFEANEYVTYDIIDYATSHRVQHFELSYAYVDWSFTLNSLKVLHLTECKFPLMEWNLPGLETLYLRDVEFTRDKGLLRFDKFKCLKKLTLIGCTELYFDGKVFKISCPSLESLEVLVGYEDARTHEFMISAPKLSFLKFTAGYVPVLSVQDGLSCLETLKVSVYDVKSLEDKNKAAKKVIGFLRNFPTTKYLTLSFHTTKVLMLGPSFSEHQVSQFGSLKSVSLEAHRPMGRKLSESEHQTNSIDCLMNYFLKTSPSAKIFIE